MWGILDIHVMDVITMIGIWPGNQGNTFALAKCVMGSLIVGGSILHLIQNPPSTLAHIHC